MKKLILVGRVFAFSLLIVTGTAFAAKTGTVMTDKNGGKYCKFKDGTAILPPFTAIDGKCHAAIRAPKQVPTKID